MYYFTFYIEQTTADGEPSMKNVQKHNGKQYADAAFFANCTTCTNGNSYRMTSIELDEQGCEQRYECFEHERTEAE